jgi:hypothetical protein
VARVSTAEIRRLPDDEKRAILASVPSDGIVKRIRNRGRLRVVIEYDREEQELGAPRYLWAFAGEAFETESDVEMVRNAINRHACTSRWLTPSSCSCRCAEDVRVFFAARCFTCVVRRLGLRADSRIRVGWAGQGTGWAGSDCDCVYA